MAKGTIGGPGVMDFYTGPLAPRYTKSDPYSGTHRSDSKGDAWNINKWQQTALNNLMQFATASSTAGMGKYTAAADSKTGWDPLNDRWAPNRLAENKWQSSQISDLEKFAASLTTPYSKANPFAATGEYSGPDTIYDKNVWQQSAISNLQDYLTKWEGGRDAGSFGLDDIARNKRKQYEDYINEQYKNLLERKDGADAEGKKYWADHLLGVDGKTAAGLEPGDSWKTWIDDQIKGSSEYKDIQVEKEKPEPIDLSKYISKDDLQAEIDKSNAALTNTLLDQFKTDLATEKGEWDKAWQGTVQGIKDQFGTQIDTLKTGWEGTSQAYKDNIADLKSVISSQQAAAAAYGNPDRPMNQTVKGVKTQNELASGKPKFKTKSDWFGRKGLRIGTSSLNI